MLADLEIGAIYFVMIVSIAVVVASLAGLLWASIGEHRRHPGPRPGV